MMLSSENIRVRWRGEVDSTFNAARELYETGEFPVWDSVVAISQTQGRGQMMRHWASPPGNLYAVMRLPDTPPYSSKASAIAVSVVSARALNDLGMTIHIKWPNDLVLCDKKIFHKIGGILIEERDACLMAGIGVNIVSSPAKQELRDDAAMSAGALRNFIKAPDADKLWLHMLAWFTKKLPPHLLASSWQGMANSLMLWVGDSVCIRDDGREYEGIFRGAGDNGEALLDCIDGLREFYSGSMRPIHITGMRAGI